jgi:ABC-2 type transport system permease protein
MSRVAAVYRRELARIFAVRPAFAVLVVALGAYAALYPQPYLAEALRDVPIAVVDRDGSASSRELVRRIDATEAVVVAQVLPDMVTAERAVYARLVYGVVLVPTDFERDLLHGRRSPVALYSDASYFLMNSRVSGNVAAAVRAYGTEEEAARLVRAGVDPGVAAAAADPLPLTAVTLFNPQAGYATYILPAAFVLILQQTLLMGIGLLATWKDEDTTVEREMPASAAAAIVGKALAYLTLHSVLLPCYLIALPYLYGVPRLGDVTTILLFAVPFVLAVSLLGLTVTALMRTPETVQLAFVALGLPLFFLSGASWPTVAIPPPIALVATFLPSTAAIDGFVRITQMGATIFDVRTQFLTLWTLVLLYGTAAIYLESSRRLRLSRGAIDRCRRPGGKAHSL